jgi:hypothetical protein
MVVSSAALRPWPETSANQNHCLLLVDGKCIVVIAAHGNAGVIHASYGKMRKVEGALRKQCLLDCAGQPHLMLHEPALALHMAGVVQYAGCLHRKRIKYLVNVIEVSRVMPGVKVEDA